MLEETVVTFTALDRCDRCRAQAKAKASKIGFVELLFCTHHKNAFNDALLDSGWTVVEDVSLVEV